MPASKIPLRVVIYVRDVENITGLRPRTAQKLLKTIRDKLGKPSTAFITVKDFVAYTGIEEDLVKEFLKYD